MGGGHKRTIITLVAQVGVWTLSMLVPTLYPIQKELI